MKRLQFPWVTQPGWIYDPDPGQNGAYREFNEESASCITGEGDFPAVAFMQVHDTDALCQLDLCAWYIKDVAQQQFRLGSDLDAEGVIGQLAYLDRHGDGQDTDMDALFLFDSTLLHELTHCKACGPRQQTLDVDETYTWKACVGAKMATNSDSLAMFCLANDLVGLGYTVLEDGRVMTAAQVEGLNPSVPDSFRAGRASPHVDDPDSPDPGWGERNGPA